MLPLLAAAAAALPAPATAFAFGVSPIRLDFDATTRTAAITVSNDDQVKLSFQVRLMRWTQDRDGTDQYEESRDLIYFPRQMMVDPQEKRVIRVGTQGAPGEAESAYRLVIEEMAPPEGPGTRGTAVAVRVRFAVPVFVAPAAAAANAMLEHLQVRGGEIRFRLGNGGKRHLKAETIALYRGDALLKQVAGWYVLPGARREFAVTVPPEKCPGPVTLVIKGEGVELRRELTLDATQCRP